ncbi:aldehyde ferredoxin oxidoreductase, partial [bacterium]|nr:aldehyde ferredoxin oxidoreductase [bacterium]
MTLSGFAGTILHVDLTHGTVGKTATGIELAGQFGGGLGLCIRLAYDLIPPACDPLSPENVMVLGAGPFVGTDLPASSRVYAVTKLPASRRIGWCGGGGVRFG